MAEKEVYAFSGKIQAAGKIEDLPHLKEHSKRIPVKATDLTEEEVREKKLKQAKKRRDKEGESKSKSTRKARPVRQEEVANNSPEGVPETSSVSMDVYTLKKQMRALQKAFGTLSDVVLDEIDAIRMDIFGRYKDCESRIQAQTRTILQVKSQLAEFASAADHDRTTLRQNVSDLHASVSKMETKTEDLRIDTAAMKVHTEHLSVKERDMTRRVEGLVTTTDTLSDWTHHLKGESAQLRAFYHTLSEESSSATKALAVDSQALADDLIHLRTHVTTQDESTSARQRVMTAEWGEKRKLDREAMESRLVTLQKNISQEKVNTCNALQDMQREAVRCKVMLDEQTTHCETTVSTVRQQVENTLQQVCTTSSTQENIQRQLSDYSLQWQRKYEAVTFAVQSLANILNAEPLEIEGWVLN